MKAATATIAVVLAIGWFSSIVDVAPSQNLMEAVQDDYRNDSWRRTKDGWEDSNGWKKFDPPRFDVSVIHPTVVAAITLFACVAGLVGFNPSTNPERQNAAASTVKPDEEGLAYITRCHRVTGEYLSK
jgi:hypothetical protein